MDELMADDSVQLLYIVMPSFYYTRTYTTTSPLNPEPVTTAECMLLVNSVSYRENQR